MLKMRPGSSVVDIANHISDVIDKAPAGYFSYEEQNDYATTSLIGQYFPTPEDAQWFIEDLEKTNHDLHPSMPEYIKHCVMGLKLGHAKENRLTDQLRGMTSIRIVKTLDLEDPDMNICFKPFSSDNPEANLVQINNQWYLPITAGSNLNFLVKSRGRTIALAGYVNGKKLHDDYPDNPEGINNTNSHIVSLAAPNTLEPSTAIPVHEFVGSTLAIYGRAYNLKSDRPWENNYGMPNGPNDPLYRGGYSSSYHEYTFAGSSIKKVFEATIVSGAHLCQTLIALGHEDAIYDAEWATRS